MVRFRHASRSTISADEVDAPTQLTWLQSVATTIGRCTSSIERASDWTLVQRNRVVGVQRKVLLRMSWNRCIHSDAFKDLPQPRGACATLAEKASKNELTRPTASAYAL